MVCDMPSWLLNDYAYATQRRGSGSQNHKPFGLLTLT
jgi:hypothetical protein